MATIDLLVPGSALSSVQNWHMLQTPRAKVVGHAATVERKWPALVNWCPLHDDVF
jgi:hypothetical protein